MILDARDPDDLDAELVGLLRAWLPDRRWFPVKGAAAELTAVASVDLADDVRVLLVRARAGSVDVLLQVPVVLVDGVTGGTASVVGTVGTRTVLDGAGHAAFLGALLAHADGPGADVDVTAARVVTGEQSNTSVILPDRATGAPAGILKVLRTVAAGENPDIDVPRRLTRQGWGGVPEPLAWAQVRWTPAAGAERAVGYLGVMSTFVPGAEDGFELACLHAREGRAFGDLARELGEVVAGMHGALAAAFGTTDDAAGPAAVSEALTTRLAWATAAVPGLADRAEGVRAVAAEVAALPATPPRQRVHGDLHLGQVLRSRGRWFVIDFEGEPLAPLAERTRPDLALRDVAGVLRSFDYAAAVGGLTGDAAAAWTADAREALLAGYAAGAPTDVDDATRTLLLRALELDKTLYEVVYEARNRPTWAPIPAAGLDRLLT
ncbi:phosphotransferase [Cellulomonas shaoxiangyii]|uniref:Maltokinase n=1 Tax=Cellulomonas shaoxiangyii TaxID=2566013 RepID=A0A4P7SNQ5_9CELL|nr:phosphotransferase [Cellulomonas shaoxiangyii]QCB94263.1 aminoglycoside phosphotransferase [Cellulomonas shaoxiangyii]TGY84502.1 aminoglycoside phosphotransferase [Cellulomonas shaoxiangyii]